MILVGIYKHGFGSWDKMLGDEALGVGKIEASVEPGTKNTPEAHLHVRANALLRRLREVKQGTRSMASGPGRQLGPPRGSGHPRRKAPRPPPGSGKVPRARKA